MPGSPLVLERSVRALLDDDRVRCDVLPALSFLDVAWARLGIDPVEAGVRLIDGHEFATAAAGATGALLDRPHPRRLGAVRRQAGRRGRHRRRAGRDPAAARYTRRADHDDDVERARPGGGGRPPDVRVRAGARHPGRRRLRPLPRAGPHAARAVPVGSRADARLARALPRRGDVRARRRPGGARPRRPGDRGGAGRGARRRPLPDRVPRHHRRAGRALLDRRRDRRDPRQAGAAPPARVR